MCSSSAARACAVVGRSFAPCRHHRPNAGHAAARWSRIAAPGSSSAKARKASEIWPAAGACSHGTAGTVPPPQSVAAIRASQPRQSDQSTS